MECVAIQWKNSFIAFVFFTQIESHIMSLHLNLSQIVENHLIMICGYNEK